MDTRANFQRLLEDMDKVIESKRRELFELDERLEVARKQLSENEARELLAETVDQDDESVSEQAAVDGKQLDKQMQEKKSSAQYDDAKQTTSLRLRERVEACERQLDAANEELLELEQTNGELVRENETLRNDASACRLELDALRAKSRVIGEHMHEMRSANLELNLRLARAESELRTQEKLLNKSHEQDQVLMAAFTEKLDKMQRQLGARDAQLRRLRARARLADEDDDNDDDVVVSVDTVDDKMSEVATLLRARDAQIEMLNNQLLQATRDLERSASLLEMQSCHDKGAREESPTQLQQLERANAMLEQELELKDKQVYELGTRVRHYEAIVPQAITSLIMSLAESISVQRTQRVAGDNKRRESMQCDLLDKLNRLFNELNGAQVLLNNIEQLRACMRKKDARIERLVDELNELDARRAGELTPNDSNSSEGSEASQTSNKADNDKDNKADKLAHDESVDLATSAQLTEQRQETMQNEQQTPEQQQQQQQQPSQASDMRNKYTTRMGWMQRRLRQVRKENELLELAMKEILLCIQVTDAQCASLLIDCPSLERLCQLIEARHIAPHESDRDDDDHKQRADTLAFQLVVLKSELDLMRGQNELLRCDAKRQRREHDKRAANVSQITVNTVQASDEHSLSDAAIQTDAIIEQEEEVEQLADTNKALVAAQEATQAPQQQQHPNERQQCAGCARMGGLASHLLQSIVRIEMRVTMSDETCLNRLDKLNELVRMLERDLSARETQLEETKRKCAQLASTKLELETRLKLMEQSVAVAAVDSMSATGKVISDEQRQIANKGANLDAHMRNARLTITLLQSIIGCLQARLDYKDERLRQLESLLLSNGRAHLTNAPTACVQ